MKDKSKKLISLFLVSVLFVSIISISAQAASYPAVYFFSDAEFSNLIIKDTATVGDIYPIRMKWYAAYNYEGYDLAVYDSRGTKVATESSSWSSVTGVEKITVNWNTTGCSAGEYTVEVTVKFYSFYNWNEAPMKKKLDITLVPNNTPTSSLTPDTTFRLRNSE